MTVYFDNAATTRVRDEAAEIAVKVMREDYGNPSSTHAMGLTAKKILETSRHNVASALGVSPDEVIFTSGGTEADNWAVFGSAELMRRRGRHIITTAIEHDAVIKPIKKLESNGWKVTYLEPGTDGRISEEAFSAALRDDTVFVSVMLVNNETGAVNPVDRISHIVRERGIDAIVHTDAVQAFCKMPFTRKTLGADLISVSSHKVHGPKGAGALCIRDGLKLPPFIFGGGQERGRRSGTEALPAIAAFGEAARLGREEMRDEIASMHSVRNLIISLISEKLPGAVVIGSGDSPHILSISLPGYKSEVLMNYLEGEGICVSRSSACKKGGRSHVLEAMRLPNEVIDGAIRVSFSRYSTEEEAIYFADKLAEAANRLFRSR